jgi:ABC-type glycerol-3-phosphate transport system substrate-binding protein
MEQDSSFNIDDYRKNIFDALLFENDQFIFPIDYGFNYYEYDASLFDESAQNVFEGYKGYSINQLVIIAKYLFQNNNEIKMFGMTNDPDRQINLTNELIEENYLNFVDIEHKKANFTDGVFAGLLETAKSFEEIGYIEKNAETTIEDFSYNIENYFFYKVKSNISLLTHYLIRDGIEILIPLPGTIQSVEKNDKIAGIQMGTNGNVKFSFTQAYGINSASKNKMLAWEFIKFLASAKMQESLQLFPSGISTLPIHNASRFKKLEDGIRMSLFLPEETLLQSAELTESQVQDYNELLEKTENFSDMINTYYVKDNTVNSIIKSELKYFFDNEKTSEETAASIQSKIEMYFNE